MADDKDNVERAKEILVYGPVGLALYLRDTAPSFLKVFVARGRAEIDQRKHSVGDKIDQARDVGESTAGTAPSVLRIVSDSLGRVRETAEGALGVINGLTGDAPSPSQSAATGTGTDATAPYDAGPATSTGASAAVTTESFGAATTSPAPAATATPPGLAIPDYDMLSASQVVDRLEGLAPEALDAIRAYETAHRGRATILGKLEQLGPTGS